jgi:hypothetical protein
MPRVYSYVVDRDYGFAPNPFHGFCTLATCKPVIRRVAKVGDWVLGTGSAYRNRTGHIVYAMRVSETMSFDEYWRDPRFLAKHPDLRGSRKQAFGDNIYHKDPNSNLWLQADSHHSLRDGTPDPRNTGNDTKTDRVLISDDFVYWGGSGVEIPEFDGINICKNGQSHRSVFSDQVVAACIGWLRSFEETGYCGRPLKWD